MTVCKRIGAWLLTLVLLVSALPYTAFAASEDSHVVNATMEETSVEDIASNVTTQLLRGAKSKNETLSMEAKPTHEDSDPVEIIVVVDDSVAKPAAQAQVKSLLQKQEKAAATMSRAIGETVEPQRQYTTLLNGFSATVTYGQYKALKELDCVESVFLSPTFSLLPDTANSTRMIGGGLANETGFTGEGMLIAILDTGVDMDHQIFSKTPANPALTQDAVKDLLSHYDFQAEGIVKDLSVSSVYKSAKFPFQFDYGDKDTDGAPGTEGSHGTHVASTAAGCTGINADVQGVAPDAQIANMNVFKSSGGASYADILSALEDCMLLGVDVANLSLGSDAGYIDYENPDEFTESLLNVFKRAGESGMSLAVAAGNAYSAAYGDAFGNKALASNPDYGLISEPSTYGESMSVAAVSNSKVKSPYITVGGRDFAYQDSGTISTDENAKIFRELAKKGDLEYAVVPGYGTEDDYEGIDVSGKVALVQRGGGMYYEQKERSAYAHGAIAMLVYNNVPGMLYMSITDWKMPCAFISQEAGEYLKAQENKVLTVGAADKLVASPTYGMADFSSWGATTELTLKPEITAPGAGIYAAVPGNAYESMDGTSMASPHAAGAMAIVQQALKARGMTDATQRKHMVDTLLMSTASIIYDSNGQPYSPRKQGAGLININDAVKTEGYLTVDGMIRPKLELGDDPAEKGVYTMTFKVHNTGKEKGNDSLHAYISNAWDKSGAQDEYLISPAVDLSATRDGLLTFDYIYGYAGMKNKTYEATVEVSTDGGQTWTPIWNFQETYHGETTQTVAGSAEIKVPAEYNVDGVQFAFHYVHPNDENAGQLAIDNVKLMAVETGEAAQKYTITATAGEGGSITPNGDVSVKEGASQTFAITADNGYEIADVLVDGNSVGAVETYTFDEVKANHTITVSFNKTATGVEFDNDFEQDEFPGHGWTVKAENTGCTWYVGTNRNLNTTRQARIDFD